MEEERQRTAGNLNPQFEGRLLIVFNEWNARILFGSFPDVAALESRKESAHNSQHASFATGQLDFKAEVPSFPG